jgi:polysaccharide biosynthesis transport protein
MATDFEEQGSQGPDLQHYLGLVCRRHLQFLIPLFVGWALVWGTSWVLPPRYQSSTLILVAEPTMPKNYVTPNVNEDLQERLQSITQQILSRTRLLHIIDQFNLYSGENVHSSVDEKVERMRKDIDIELVRDQGQQITAFNVSYSSRDPHLAQKITGELTNLFINENLEVREQQSEETTKFLGAQLESVRNTLAEQENKIRLFKAQHVGEMPEQLASNLQILGGLQSQLQTEDDALNVAKQQRVYLQTLADQSRVLEGSSKGDAPAVGLPGLDQELEKLRAELADLSSHYTDRHPDVRKLKDQIARTEKMREQLLAAAKTSSNADTQDIANATSQEMDPAQATATAQIQSQLRANQLEISNREHAIAALKTKIDDYQARLNQEPVREQQLLDLTRGYEQSKANYDDLLKKRNESAMATSMEIAQQGQRFTVVDPPSLPQKPNFPNRLKFCAMGFAVGVALGCIVVGALEMKDDRVYSEKELKNLLPSTIIVELPAIVTDADEGRDKRRIRMGWAVAAIVFATILAGSAFSVLFG